MHLFLQTIFLLQRTAALGWLPLWSAGITAAPSGPSLQAGRTLCFEGDFLSGTDKFDAGWSSPVARQAHNLKVTGSNPVPAPKQTPDFLADFRGFSFSEFSAKNAKVPQWYQFFVRSCG